MLYILFYLEIGAYNVNWWNTNLYKVIPSQEIPIKENSPYKLI